MRLSIEFPNTHRYTMFPARCMKPPCMNMEVKTVPQVGIGVATSTRYAVKPLLTSKVSIWAPPSSSVGYDAEPVRERKCTEVVQEELVEGRPARWQR